MTMGVTNKTKIIIKVNVKSVKLAEVTPARRRLYIRFWEKVFAEVKASE